MILGIVTARLRSSRLPAKALLPMYGNTMVGHVVSMLNESNVDGHVLCTPDSFLTEFVLCPSVIWQGERDITSELRNAAKLNFADHVVRVTADCPFVTPEIINRVIKEHLESGADYTYNHHDHLPSSTPEGIDVEVVTVSALQKLRGKEHLYNGEKMKIHRVDMEEEREVFSVNTLDEYMRAFKEL
ncbi:hypothetical protein LCGC14_0638170 [marine sediment metagenome]|uniref:MobA-like NTP transferase domain-containing protein n=1 Tax=marine sediment metagenome TaxID=412755 RepID=A0A0F9TLG0_9ZZZZ